MPKIRAKYLVPNSFRDFPYSKPPLPTPVFTSVLSADLNIASSCTTSPTAADVVPEETPEPPVLHPREFVPEFYYPSLEVLLNVPFLYPLPPPDYPRSTSEASPIRQDFTRPDSAFSKDNKVNSPMQDAVGPLEFEYNNTLISINNALVNSGLSFIPYQSLKRLFDFVLSFMQLPSDYRNNDFSDHIKNTLHILDNLPNLDSSVLDSLDYFFSRLDNIFCSTTRISCHLAHLPPLSPELPLLSDDDLTTPSPISDISATSHDFGEAEDTLGLPPHSFFI